MRIPNPKIETMKDYRKSMKSLELLYEDETMDRLVKAPSQWKALKQDIIFTINYLRGKAF